MPAETCPTPLKLEAFAAGGLPPEERQRIAAHIAGCERCQPRPTQRLGERERERLVSESTPPSPGREPAEAAFPPEPGQTVARRYVIIGPVGSGGAATVLSAYDKALDRRVALKFLNLTTPGAVSQLLQEASSMAKLQHPNVVTVYDVGQLGEAHFIAMELVDGENLAQWRTAAPRSRAEIVRVMAGAARGLAAAHAAGLIHRDVKPQNILVAGPRVLVTDFGISVRTDQTSDWAIAGTPSYMAPEQYGSGLVDRRADVFSFCATLYEMLYGQRPFPAETVTAVRARAQRGQIEIPAGAKVPTRLHRLIQAGLSVDPADRPADMDRIADELLRDPRRVARNGLAGGAALALVLAAFLGGGHLRRAPERQCRAGAAAIDETLGPATRATLAAHFGQAGQSAVWTATERVFDGFARRWRAMYQQACTATYVERRQSSELHEVRRQCLQSRRTALAGLVTALGRAPAAALLDAPTAAARLPPVAECEVAGQIQLLPADPAGRKQLDEVEQLIAGAFAEAFLGDHAAATRSAEAAVTRARALGYQPLLARALTQAARLEQQASRRAAEGEALARAARLLEEAATVAERGRADLRRAIALRDLMMVNLQRGEPRAAELYSQLASAALDRLGDPPEERAAYLLNEGWRKRTFRVGDGGADFRRSLELRRRVLAENDPDLVPSLIAVCLDEQAGAARSCHRRALDTARNALGPSHVYIGHIYVNLAAALKRDPATATEACDLLSQASAIYELAGDRERASAVGARADLATCLRDTGRVAEARAIYDRLLASEPAPSAQRARIHQTYGRFLADQGEREPAVRHLKAALSEGRQHTGECSDTVIETVTSLGAALRSLGRAAEALEQLSQTASACERSGGEPLNLATLYHALGTTLAGRRRPGEAVDALTRALDLHSHAAAPAATVAETELALALALVAQPDPRPGDHARACALAEQALTRQRGGKPSEEMVATARWLTRRCPASVRKRARARTTPPPGCRRWSPGGVLSSSSICRCRRRASRSA